ncbi:MAG: BatA domain-containing protein [Planctomycetota bacterium]|jgi:hypothetical protein
MFLNPFFLIGSLAASVPLAIHLMHRRRTRIVEWPSIRFLKVSNRRTSRRRQIEEVLLLALRMALLAFLSVALSRPILRAAGAGGGETAVVVVLDNSMSTSAVSGKTTRFARAKRAAEAILKEAPPGSWMALRLADGSESAAAHAVSKNREAVSVALRASSVSDARGDLGARVAEAIADAAGSSAARPEVHVLTDFQATAFARASMPKRARRPVQLVFTDCGAEPPRSVAVTEVAVRARRFVAGAPLGVDVRLNSFSRASEERKIVLTVDGEGEKEGARAERLRKVKPTGAIKFTFQLTLDRAGERTGRVHISPGDELPADDVRYFRVHLAERVPVLVVERSGSRIASARPSFFLATALAPGKVRSPIVPKVTAPGYLAGKSSRALFAESPVAILADLGGMDQAEASSWVEYVRAGGTLVAFPSAAGGLEGAARALEAAAGAPFLPAAIGPATGDAEARSSPRKIDVERADLQQEDVLAPFRDLDSTLKAVTVWRAYGLRATHSAAGRSVLAFEDGTAFLAARKLGEGEVYLFAVPAGTEWSDLPARSLFLPLVHTLVYRASAPREEERSFLAGTSARVSLPPAAAGKIVHLTEPGGRVRELKAEARDDATEAAAEVAIDTLARAGIYRLEGEGLVEPVALVVNTDPEESDPARIGPSRLRTLYLDAARTEPVFVGDPADLSTAVSRIRKGVELWDYILMFVLSLALFECFYANRLAAGSRKKMDAASAVAA